MSTPCGAVVAPLRSGCGSRDRRLATLRVAADVVAVRLVLDVLRPAKKAALYIVVANCETPPPTSVDELAARRSAGPATKPAARSRGPTCAVEAVRLPRQHQRRRRRGRRWCGCWYPGPAAGVRGGERADDLRDAQRLACSVVSAGAAARATAAARGAGAGSSGRDGGRPARRGRRAALLRRHDDGRRRWTRRTRVDGARCTAAARSPSGGEQGGAVDRGHERAACVRARR